MRVQGSAVSDEGSTVIFHYVVIESDAGGFDVQAYRNIDEACQTADAIADALGIRQPPPTVQAQCPDDRIKRSALGPQAPSTRLRPWRLARYIA